MVPASRLPVIPRMDCSVRGSRSVLRGTYPQLTYWALTGVPASVLDTPVARCCAR